jgi:hypothetical protein
MKIIQAFENFHAFENSGSDKDPKVSGLSSFINKSLLGGYISDIAPNNISSIAITISDKSGTLGTIIYWLHDLFWQLDGLRDKKTPEDAKLLSEIGAILDRDN